MKIVFKNKTFYYLFVIYILILISWNLYAGIKTGNSSVTLPITIQSILLILSISHYKYARIAIIVWTVIFQIGGFALIVSGSLIKATMHGLQSINGRTFTFDSIEIAIGITILIYIKRTVVVKAISAQTATSEIVE